MCGVYWIYKDNTTPAWRMAVKMEHWEMTSLTDVSVPEYEVVRIAIAGLKNNEVAGR